MSHKLIDALDFSLIAGVGVVLSVHFDVVAHEELRERFQMDAAVQLGTTMGYLLLKKNSLPVELFFLLSLSESRLRYPCHVMPDLASVDVVSIGHCDFVATALFSNTGHIFSFPLAPWSILCYYKRVDYGLG